MNNFKTVGVVGRRNGNQEIADTLLELIQYLEDRHLEVVLEDHAARLVPGFSGPVCESDQLGQRCDLAIVVGGDGSMLTAARALAVHHVPVVGINRGGLGFLTDIAPDQMQEKLDEILDGQYNVGSRFLLDAHISLNHQPLGNGYALNDVVLSSSQSARMIEFELYIDDCFVYSQRSNGLIVSTPTGSTAYALSGGGPIMTPTLDAIVLVPMFPHTLTARPIVIEGHSVIKIVPGSLHDTNPSVSCDGHTNFVISPGDEVIIRKMPSKLTLLHPLGQNFYESCRNKLGWGSRLGQQY